MAEAGDKKGLAADRGEARIGETQIGELNKVSVVILAVGRRDALERAASPKGAHSFVRRRRAQPRMLGDNVGAQPLNLVVARHDEIGARQFGDRRHAARPLAFLVTSKDEGRRVSGGLVVDDRRRQLYERLEVRAHETPRGDREIAKIAKRIFLFVGSVLVAVRQDGVAQQFDRIRQAAVAFLVCGVVRRGQLSTGRSNDAACLASDGRSFA